MKAIAPLQMFQALKKVGHRDQLLRMRATPGWCRHFNILRKV